MKRTLHRLLDIEPESWKTSHKDTPIYFFFAKNDVLQFGLVVHGALDVSAPSISVKFKGEPLDFPQFCLNWDLNVANIEERLKKAIESILVQGHARKSTFSIAYGLSSDRLLTVNPDYAGFADLKPFIVRGQPKLTDGIASQPHPALQKSCRVTIFGCDSVGGLIADNLARKGISLFRLVDDAEVSGRDLYAVHNVQDLSSSRTQSIARRIFLINPQATIACESKVSNVDEFEGAGEIIIVSGDYKLQNFAAKVRPFHYFLGLKLFR